MSEPKVYQVRTIMNRYLCFHSIATLLFLTVFIQAADRHPNVIVFLSDDQGWGDLSSSGSKNISTPNIDSLAKDGASFDRFFVCPVCSPTRAEFLTGRHHAHSGVYSTSAGGERIDLDETTVADLFKSAGYRTGAFGKWHNGMQFPYHPTGRGFDEFYGFCSGHWGNYFSPMLDHNNRIVTGQGFCIDDFTDKALDFIDKSARDNKPFFAYLAYNTPHSPMQVPEPFWRRHAGQSPNTEPKKERPKKLKDAGNFNRCVFAMCENLDMNVGRVLKKLDTLGIADDTIVIWFHDNGPVGNRFNGGMKGKKGSTDEGGVRSPLYIRWPSRIKKGKQIQQIASARDLLPTLCDLAEITNQSKKPLDGLSLKPLLMGQTKNWPDRILVNQWRNRISVRSQRFRLDHTGKLFDMVADPGQKKDVSQMHPEIVKQLGRKQKSHRDSFMASYFQDDRPFVIAHPGSTFTQLPARDGEATGNIKRSNRFPNCSYFRNWTSVEDRISFAAQVESSGTYHVQLYYAAKNAGAKFELKFNEAILRFQIDEAHDVPELGAKDDRHPRNESYVKNFKSISVGRIKLQKGKGLLTLRATEIPGKQAIEFRMLTLQRVE